MKKKWWWWKCDKETSENENKKHKKDDCKKNQIKAARVKEYKRWEMVIKDNKLEFEYLHKLNGLGSPDYYCLPPRVFIKKKHFFAFEDGDKANKEDIIKCHYCDEPAVRISHYTREGNKTTCLEHLAQRYVDYIMTGKVEE